MSKSTSTDKNLVILASTFPRWKNDNVPTFVQDFSMRIASHFKNVTVIAPHFPGARLYEEIGPRINVQRFRYAYPYKYENLAYGQFKKTKFYSIKVLLYAVSEFWLTLRVCIKSRPSIINAHWLIPQGFVAVLVAPLVGAKVVVSVHGSDVFTLNGKMMRKIKRFTLRHASEVIANSSATQEACRMLWPNRTYPVVPMGIDVEQFGERRVPPRAKEYKILFVGRLVRHKGVMYLCQAMKLLHSEYRDMHLDIVGEGPERDAIALFVKENNLEDAISLCGWEPHSRLPARYAAADVFVGPSVEDTSGAKEALGLVFAEASAAALPVVATNVGGIKDVVKESVTGIIIPQKDPQAIAEALKYLHDNMEVADSMGMQGRLYVNDQFSWKSVVERYLRLVNCLN